MAHIRVFLVLACSFCFAQSFGQSCDCPAAGDCAPCSGGFTSLTLRFNGGAASTITASDQIGQVFSGVVTPGSEFTFTGSIQNDKFAGPSVTLTVNGSFNTTIDSNCGGGTTVGSIHGSFTVVQAVSKNGGLICCTPGLEDTELPVISNCPTTITRSLGAACTLAVSWVEPTATDNCEIASFENSIPPGSQFGPGTTPVTYTAKDAYGNMASCTFDVIVTDNTLPVFTGCPANIVVSAAANCKAVVSWTEPVASDNCGITGSGKSHNPNNEFDFGITTVTYTATDAAGNTGICSFTIKVEDNTDPVFTNCPSNITVSAGVNCKATAAWVPPVASDNCGVAGTVESHASGFEFEIGPTVVTYMATDVNGRSSTCSFTVTVAYAEVPQVTGCPSNQTGISDDTDEAVITWTEPVFTTRCGSLTVQRSHEPGSRFRTGHTEVVYTASDELGSTAECRFRVDIELPELELEISKLVTPDGDGFNDFWKVTNLENYPDNHVTIFDRWGSALYEASGYDNDAVAWRGTNKNNTLVSNGTYFYVLEITYGRQKLKREGFIELLK